jgi:hypothetical protein
MYGRREERPAGQARDDARSAYDGAINCPFRFDEARLKTNVTTANCRALPATGSVSLLGQQKIPCLLGTFCEKTVAHLENSDILRKVDAKLSIIVIFRLTFVIGSK